LKQVQAALEDKKSRHHKTRLDAQTVVVSEGYGRLVWSRYTVGMGLCVSICYPCIDNKPKFSNYPAIMNKLNLSKQISFLLVILAVFVLSFTIAGQALDTNTKIDTTEIKKQIEDTKREVQKTLEETKIQAQQARNAAAIARCEVITTNITTQITRFEQGKSARVESFQSIKTKLDDLIKKLEGKNIDTATLKAYLAVLDGKIKATKDKHESYVTTLSNTKTSSCGKAEVEFKSSLEQARTELKSVRDSAKDVQDYIQNTIRPEVQKIRDQIKK
jgi:hypothetical protein